jgi:hypothetical protein
MTPLVEQTADDDKLYELLSLPSLLIVVDAWAKNSDDLNYQSVIKTIVDFVTNKNSFLQAVALASYTGLDNDQVVIEEPWYTNAQKLFYDSTKWEVLRNVWQKTTFQMRAQTFTHENILSLARDTGREYFILWDYNQLLYYINYVNPCVKNIIIAGFAWGCCLEFRSLGHTALSNLLYYNMLDRNCNILSHKKMVGLYNEQSLDVYDPWIEIGCDWLKIDMERYAKMMEDYES